MLGLNQPAKTASFCFWGAQTNKIVIKKRIGQICSRPNRNAFIYSFIFLHQRFLLLFLRVVAGKTGFHERPKLHHHAPAIHSPCRCHLGPPLLLPRNTCQTMMNSSLNPGQGKLTATFRAACQHEERSIPGLRRPMSRLEKKEKRFSLDVFFQKRKIDYFKLVLLIVGLILELKYYGSSLLFFCLLKQPEC